MPISNSRGLFFWTGKSNGWQQVKICFTYLAIKPQLKMSWPFGFRFLFKSDSIQNNKPGWIIDKVRFSTPHITFSTSAIENHSLPIYPNPSSNGVFYINYPDNYVNGKIYFFDFLGRNVRALPLMKKINLGNLPSGLYTYKAVFERTEQWFSGTIEIIK